MILRIAASYYITHTDDCNDFHEQEYKMIVCNSDTALYFSLIQLFR